MLITLLLGITNNYYICKKLFAMKKENKVIKSVKLKPSTVQAIEKVAKKEKRTTHYLMVECLEKKFK